MKINEVAKTAGVTVRTLQYYDKIGLLRPSEVTQAGYRLYDETALSRLQQILFFRELDFSLAEIREIMANPRYDRTEALSKQRTLLLQKRRRLDGLIGLLEQTMKGETDMSFTQFDRTEIEQTKRQYADEVKARWGDTAAYAESERRTAGYDDEKWAALSDEGKAILRDCGQNRTLAPDSPQAQALVARWQAYITAHFYPCTKEILSCLGEMYIGDARFTQNIDQNGAGTAAFLSAAIAAYCKK